MRRASEPIQRGFECDEGAAARRRAHVRPLPGGGERYKETLDAVVRCLDVADAAFAPADATRLLETIGLVQREGERFELTRAGVAYRAAPRPELLFERLNASYEGFLEALVLAGSRATTRRAGRLLTGLVERRWKAPRQVSRRRSWLRSLGLTEPTSEGDALTPLGRGVLDRHAPEVREIRRRIDDLFEEELAADVARAEAFEPLADEEPRDAESRLAESRLDESRLGEARAGAVNHFEGSMDEAASRMVMTPRAWGEVRLDLTADMLRAHLGGLEFPDTLLARVAAALSSGKHLLLAGPPGTGKTELAFAIGEAARAAGHCQGALPVTGSSDWTTFDTVGGYALGRDGALRFRPGVFLAALERRQWLLVDELNRADVDRAFGELLTVLAGRETTTPFALEDGRLVSIGPGPGATHRVPPTFRLLATMNTWDKTSLFRMSYALERRFAIVHVGVPADDRYARLLALHGTRAAADPPLDPAALAALTRLFCSTGILAHRPVGPAIAIDMIGYLRRRGAASEGLAEAVAIHLVPQLEGLDVEAAAAIRDRVIEALSPVTSRCAMAELAACLRALAP